MIPDAMRGTFLTVTAALVPGLSVCPVRKTGGQEEHQEANYDAQGKAHLSHLHPIPGFCNTLEYLQPSGSARSASNIVLHIGPAPQLPGSAALEAGSCGGGGLH